MKKIILSLLLCFSIDIVAFATPSYACEKLIKEEPDNKTIDLLNIDSDNETIQVSEAMSLSDIINHYMDLTGASYEEALSVFPSVSTFSLARSSSYRTLSVNLPVTSTYKPHIEFFCQTSESGNYWGITKIYSIQLVRSYNNVSYQFQGQIEAWLRSCISN